MSEILFIADLHLSAERPRTVAAFLEFCQRRAVRADGLFILGDLFDAWIGDDNDTPPIPEIRAALKALSDKGVRVQLQHGNRDFLLGERFLEQTGATLLSEEHALDLFGTPTLLMHGDTLCTDDVGYQAARKTLRDPAMIAGLLAKSLEERAAIAAEYRRRSGEATSLLADDIMDVNADAVADALRRHDAKRLIHGHTHRKNAHPTQVDGETRERIVLGDWRDDHPTWLSVTPDAIRFDSD